MFQSNTKYRTENGEEVRILVSGESLEGFIFCGCCTFESTHSFDLRGNSLCKDSRCKHGNLVEKIDTSVETYSLKKESTQSSHP